MGACTVKAGFTTSVVLPGGRWLQVMAALGLWNASVPGWAESQQRFPDQSPHHERFVASAGGPRLELLDWGGSGEVVLFVPGLGQSAHIFDGLAPRFTTRYHCIGLTRRGHGRSDAPQGGYDITTLVDDLARVIDALGDTQVVLVGHSFAGIELTEFARRHPHRVSGLVYLEAAYDYSRMPDPSKDPLSTAPAPQDLANLEAARRWFERAFGFWHEAVGADANEVNLQPDGSLRLQSMRADVADALWKTMIAYRPRYDAIRAPVLAVYAVSAYHPLARHARATVHDAADRFWRESWRPYQDASIAQLVDSGGPTVIRILRDTQHMCFLRPEDERQVVDAMTAFLSELS
jgi:non-heme chloroperoxidase